MTKHDQNAEEITLKVSTLRRFNKFLAKVVTKGIFVNIRIIYASLNKRNYFTVLDKLGRHSEEFWELEQDQPRIQPGKVSTPDLRIISSSKASQSFSLQYRTIIEQLILHLKPKTINICKDYTISGKEILNI